MDPSWKPSQASSSPVQKMVSVRPSDLDSKSVYKWMIGAIVPRPIAFISTLNLAGEGNLAPFSFFNGVSSRPPALMVAITRKSDGLKKDTLINIETTGQFVVNSVNEWLVEAANQCSANYPYGVDEMKKVGLTPIPSVLVQPPRVQEAAIQFECELLHQVEVGDGQEGSSTVIIGKIVMMHFFDQACKNGKLDITQLKPVARLAGADYAPIHSVFSLPRPQF